MYIVKIFIKRQKWEKNQYKNMVLILNTVSKRGCIFLACIIRMIGYR